MKNRYLSTAISIYINYIIIGVSVIVFSLNMDSLIAQWDTTIAGFGFVISGIGIGKFIVVFIAGIFSDKLGRKPFIMAGIVGYIVCFIGVLYSQNIYVAFAFTIISGFANALIDSGSYAALAESFPSAPGTANLFIKISIAIGQFTLPLFISFIIIAGFSFKISFYVLIAILIANFIFMKFCVFPPIERKQQNVQADSTAIKMVEKPKLHLEGIALILYGYTSTAGLTICQMWLQKIGYNIAGMGLEESNALMSYFSVGTLTSVFITAFLVKSILRPALVTFLYPIISVAIGIVLFIYPTPLVCKIAAFLFGYSIAGGILQLAITSLMMFFPGNGGKCAGAVTSLNSIAIWTIPLITGLLATQDVKNIIIFLIITCALGCVFGFVAMLRDRKVFGIGRAAS